MCWQWAHVWGWGQGCMLSSSPATDWGVSCYMVSCCILREGIQSSVGVAAGDGAIWPWHAALCALQRVRAGGCHFLLATRMTRASCQCPLFNAWLVPVLHCVWTLCRTGEHCNACSVMALTRGHLLTHASRLPSRCVLPVAAATAGTLAPRASSTSLVWRQHSAALVTQHTPVSMGGGVDLVLQYPTS